MRYTSKYFINNGVSVDYPLTQVSAIDIEVKDLASYIRSIELAKEGQESYYQKLLNKNDEIRKKRDEIYGDCRQLGDAYYSGYGVSRFIKPDMRASETAFYMRKLFDNYYVDDRLLENITENEFSASAYFKQPVLPLNFEILDDEGAPTRVVLHRCRIYYKENTRVFYNNRALAIGGGDYENDPDMRVTNLTCITRYDHKVKETDPDYHHCSVKLRVARHECGFEDVSVMASSSIELPIELESYDSMQMMSGTRKREFCFWYCTLPGLTNTNYVFKIAFRREMEPTSRDFSPIRNNMLHHGDGFCECNIECESDITLEEFGLLFYALFCYYYYIYESNGNIIYPMITPMEFDEFTRSKRAMDLNVYQLLALSRMRLLPYEEVKTIDKDEYNEGDAKSSKIIDLVKYMGLRRLAFCNGDAPIESAPLKNIIVDPLDDDRKKKSLS